MKTEEDLSPYKIKFLNHASFYFENDEEIIIMDPWLEGKVFNNSWALLADTPEDVIDLKKIKHILITHDHPDHLNWASLKKISSQTKDVVVHITPRQHQASVLAGNLVSLSAYYPST